MAEGIIGTGITDSSHKQIELREGLLKNKGTSQGDSKWQQLYTSKTGWVKLSSSVNINGDSTKASSNVLASRGITGDGVNAGYKKGPLGNRPVPGITGVNIVSQNRFGTLRKSVVEFKAYDVNQLSDLEQLYLRPGFSILLEWGHTVYKTNSGEVVTAPRTVQNFFADQSSSTIEKAISEIRDSSDGNYDAVFGYISNFQWSFNIDGSYNCRVDIISKGEVLESIEYAIYQKRTSEESPASEKTLSPLHKILYTIQENIEVDGNVNINSVTAALSVQTGFPVVGSPISRILEGSVRAYRPPSATGPSQEGDSPFISYIKLGAFLDIITEYVLLRTKGATVITPFNTTLKSTFVTYPGHHSGHPGIAMIGDGNSLLFGEIGRRLQIGDYSDISNIWVNIDYILTKLTAGILETGRSPIMPVLEKLLAGIEGAFGGINEFDIAYDEDGNYHYIVDRRNVGTGKDLPAIRVSGKGNTVTNLSITSKLGPSLAKMISISAQASKNVADVGIEAENLFKWNEGLTDRIITERIGYNESDAPNIPGTKDSEKYTQAKEEFAAASLALTQFGELLPKNYDDARSAHRLIAQHELKRYLNSAGQQKLSKPGIIPFEVSMTLDGISGLKIGQAFQIDDPIFPDRYKDRIAFIITGLDHKIEANRWVTNIKAQTINKPQS